MNRLLRIVLLLVGQRALAPLTAEPALVDPIGAVIVTPGTGTNLDQIRLWTFASCPAQGMIITDYPTAHGFDLRIGPIIRDHATKNHTTLTSRYHIIVYRIDHFYLQIMVSSPARRNSPFPQPMRLSEHRSRSDRSPAAGPGA